MSAQEIAFVADRDLRLAAPRDRDRSASRRVLATLAAVFIDLAVLGVVWYQSASTPVTPAQQEIPVEIVEAPPPEPPPPPPPPPAPEPSPQTSTPEYEKPAIDAPRAGKSDHDDDTVAEKPKPAEAPPPPAPTSPPTPEPSAAPPAPAPEAPKEAEAELPAPVKAEPTNTPAPHLSQSLADVMAKALQPIPNVEFGGEAMNSPITGGNAKSTYLSKLYGLIVPRLRVPEIAHAFGRKLTGSVSFSVDGRGRLLQRYVTERSGSLELDEAAMEAVAAASRSFPAPPRGAPVGMTFTYTVN